MPTPVGLLKEGTKCKYEGRTVEVCDRSLRAGYNLKTGSTVEPNVRLKFEDGRGTYVPLNTKVEAI